MNTAAREASVDELIENMDVDGVMRRARNLERENARLRAALEKIRDYIPIDEMTVAPALPVAPRRLQEIARAAISGAA